MNVVVKYSEITKKTMKWELFDGSFLTILCEKGISVPIEILSSLVDHHIAFEFKQISSSNKFLYGLMYLDMLNSLSSDDVVIDDDTNVISSINEYFDSHPNYVKMHLYSSMSAYIKVFTGDEGKAAKKSRTSPSGNVSRGKKSSSASKAPEKGADTKAKKDNASANMNDNKNALSADAKIVNDSKKSYHTCSSFDEVLEEVQISKDIKASKRDTKEIYKIVRDAVDASTEDIGLAVQLRIRILDTDLSDKIYKKIQGRFKELKQLA